MGVMSGRLTAILGIAGAATLGIYLKFRHGQQKNSRIAARKSSLSAASASRIDIDDDEAADIIKRARPALERARLLYGY